MRARLAMVEGPRPGAYRRVLEPTHVSTLRVAVVENRVRDDQLASFCRALARAIGAQSQGVVLESYAQVVHGLATSQVDFAWLPPVPAARALIRGAVVPLALPVRDGVFAYSSALFTRTNSSMRSLKDLRRARSAWVDPDSASGYLAMRAFLQSQGIVLEEAFGDERFLGRHERVVRAVLAGDADVGATYAYPKGHRIGGRAAGWRQHRVHVIAHVGPIPSDVVVASAALPEAIVLEVQKAIVDQPGSEMEKAARAVLGAERFVAPLTDYLEPFVSLLRRFEIGSSDAAATDASGAEWAGTNPEVEPELLDLDWE
jgi:phosphate/phosphite/phosphonate ABC transporter binding protein